MPRLRLPFAMARIAPDSHVTLHYRLAALVDGTEREVISTHGGHPATLQLGGGHLAASLETRLLGLAEGDAASFELQPAEAFGERNPQLVQALSRTAFDANAEAGGDYSPGDVVEFTRPDGGRVAGVLKESDERRVVVDFNHPLAGMPVRFSVRVIGVL
jgi:FKBP-type peptidyl-prolyl cis-trans isomerase SlpA